ncbi:MAG: hypothetical protein GY820_42145 [Gammaproteobacteria bacterium]|nr:hypothetical protein [Gammaproteobacteria bacterium]
MEEVIQKMREAPKKFRFFVFEDVVATEISNLGVELFGYLFENFWKIDFNLKLLKIVQKSEKMSYFGFTKKYAKLVKK